MLKASDKREVSVIELGLVRESRFRGFAVIPETDASLCAAGSGWGYAPPAKKQPSLGRRLRALLRKEPADWALADRILHLLAVRFPGQPFTSSMIVGELGANVDHLMHTLTALVEEGLLNRRRSETHERCQHRGHPPWIYWAESAAAHPITHAKGELREPA